MGADDPFSDCVLPPAAVRGVSTAAPSDTEQPPASTSVVPETNEPASQEQARKRVRVATASSCSRSSDSTLSSEIPPNQQAAAVIAPSSAASAPIVAPSAPSAVWRNFSLPDEDIVTYFTIHPEEDGTKYANELLRQGTISYEDATVVASNMSRVKKVMAKYAVNLLIRRSQVQDHSCNSAADAYLRDQLYAQSGQKL